MPNSRTTCFAVCLLLGFGAAVLASWPFEAWAWSRILAWLLLSVAGLGCWLSFPDARRGPAIVLVLLSGLLARLLILGVPASDDVHRYLWEGRLVAEGENPYLAPADDVRWEGWRDAQWERMNHRDRLTAYPPLIELLFATVSFIAYSPFAYKLLFGAADFGILLLLVFALARARRPVSLAMLYALGPVPLLTGAGEGHFDSLFVLALVGFVWAWRARRLAIACACLGVAIALKLMAAVLLPWLLLRFRGWQLGWLVLPLLLPAIPFLDGLDGLVNGLFGFGAGSAFNGPLHQPLRWLIGDMQVATLLCALLYLLWLAWVSLRVRTVERAALLALGGLLVCSPIVHFWYLLWLLPFAIWAGSLAWSWACASFALYYLSWASVQAGGDWALPAWASTVIWLPTLLLLLWEGRFLRRASPSSRGKVERISLVIPCLNDEAALRGCLSHLRKLPERPFEIVLADGGSEDGSAALAQEEGVRWVTAPRGRGCQLRAGVEQARGDCVLVLHADCRLSADALGAIREAFARRPELLGGALGQRFGRPGFKLLFIEGLNEMRATLGGTSFGDQAQFFHRESLQRLGGFPDLPLMEDVELSLKLMRAGEVCLLDTPVQASARRWQREGFGQRVWLVFSLVLRYRWARLLGRDNAQRLYQRYYRS